jgi:hypothetical protein
LKPVEYIILNKLVSPIICVGQFNHQNQLGKGLTLFPFQKQNTSKTSGRQGSANLIFY